MILQHIWETIRDSDAFWIKQLGFANMFVLSIKEIENFKGCPLPAYLMNHVQLLVRHTMESSCRTRHSISYALMVVPIIGMDIVHKYGWEHWEPFDKHHK